MRDLEMRLGKEIAEAVEKDNVVAFRNETTNQKKNSPLTKHKR